MLLRDSESNIIKLFNDWGIRHFPCVGHSLYLVVGPFLVVQKGEKPTSQNNSMIEDEDNIDGDGLSDTFDTDCAMKL